VVTAHEALRAQLIEARDDVALWSVYADSLQHAGDPHGALVTIMLERERAPSQRLLAAELAYRKEHVAQLVPACLRRHVDAIGWRRGFMSELPVPTLQALAALIADPAMAFVEAARIELDAGELSEYLELLEGVELPWRRVHLAINNGGDSLELGPLFAYLPKLEELAVVFSEYDQASTEWAGASAPNLRRLTIDNGVEVTGLDAAELPALEELRLIGTTLAGDLAESDLCQRLKRVVLGNQNELPDRANVVRHARDTEAYEDVAIAFIAIHRLVDATLVEDLARSLQGLHGLVVTTGHLDGADPFTVIRLAGSGAAELLPYGLAVLLESHLPPKTAIVMFHSAVNGTARAFALGDRPVSHTDARGATLLRNMIDLALGHDVGSRVLDAMIEALDMGQTTAVIGTGANVEVLTDIDPGSLGQLPEPDDYDEEIPEATADLYTQPETEEVAEAIESPDDLTEIEDEPLVDEDDEGDETEEGRDAWVRLLAQWEDPDEELAERFPDPVLQWEDVPDLDGEPAAGACNDCGLAKPLLRACTSCGGLHCATCAVEDKDNNVWCRRCIAELEVSSPES
jgi:hypothetical protein